MYISAHIYIFHCIFPVTQSLVALRVTQEEDQEACGLGVSAPQMHWGHKWSIVNG